MLILLIILSLILIPVTTYFLNSQQNYQNIINIIIGLLQFALGIWIYLDYRHNQNVIKKNQKNTMHNILKNILKNLNSLNDILYNAGDNINSENYATSEYKNILIHLDNNANVMLGQIRISNNDEHEKLSVIHKDTLDSIFYGNECNYTEFINHAISINKEINKIIGSSKPLIKDLRIKYPYY